MEGPEIWVEHWHQTNIAKLRELAETANEKGQEASAEFHEINTAYWSGMEFGLRRAINVLEGKG